MYRRLNKLFMVLALVAVLGVSLAVPASAYPSGYQDYRFYAYFDGNNNGYLDYWSGQDECLWESRTLTVAGAEETIPQPWFQVTLPSGSDFVVDSNEDFWLCVDGSSTTRNIKVQNYMMGCCSFTTYFMAAYNSDPDVRYQAGNRHY